jgi:hypothetical protein
VAAGGACLVTDIKWRKSKRLGHVIRVAQRRLAKKCIENKRGGRINTGRSKLKWLENTENALGEVEGDRWRQKANREEWESVMKEIKVFRAKE